MLFRSAFGAADSAQFATLTANYGAADVASAATLNAAIVAGDATVTANFQAADATLLSRITAPATLFQATSRYQVVSTSGQEVHVHSSSKAYGNLAWARTGTSLTVTHTSHGHTSGERVILHNINVDYLCVTIDSVSTDTFTVTCANSGANSGTAANYSMGFTYAHNAGSGSITNGTLSAPAGTENVQLISMRVRLSANVRQTNTYDIIVPASATNGAGVDASASTVYLPMHTVKQDTDNLTATTGTIAMNPSSGGYNRFQIAALPTAATGIYLLFQF